MSKTAKPIKRMPRTIGDKEWWDERNRRAIELLDNKSEALFRDAQEAFDYGMWILLSFTLNKAHAEEAKSMFTGRLGELIERQLPSWVREGNDEAVDVAWSGCVKLTEALHDIALKKPDILKTRAQLSVFFPSLRATPKNFTHDFNKIAKDIELGSQLPVKLDLRTQSRFDKPITRLVLEIVLEVESVRRRMLHSIELYKWLVSEDHENICRLASRGRAHRYAHLKMLREAFLRAGQSDEIYRQFKEMIGDGEQRETLRAQLKRIPKFCSMTQQEYLIEEDHYAPETLSYAELQPFTRANAEVWWEQAVKPWLDKHGLQRIGGSPLYDQLKQNTSQGKEYEVKDELKRRCGSCLKRLAPPE